MKRSWVAVAALATLFAAEASASGFLVARFGGEHGHPTTSNATAMYYNPAGLALGSGTGVFLDGSLAWRVMEYDRDPGAVDNPLEPGDTGSGTPNTAEGLEANAGKGTLTNILGSPFLGITSDFGVEGLGLGLGFYVPFGGSSVYDQGDHDPAFPGAEDGAQRWWVVQGTIRSLYFTAAGAYHIPAANLSIGLSLNAVRSEINTLRGRNANGTDSIVNQVDDNGDGSPDRTSLQEGRARIDVSSLDLSVGAGLIWQPAEGWWVGVSYQSQPGFGENELEGTFQQVLATGAAEDERDINLYQSLPDVIRLGGRWRPGQTQEIRLFGDYTRWSLFEDQRILGAGSETTECSDVDKLACIPRRWDDAFGVRAGYSYWLNPDVELYLGAGYDANAVPDETVDPSLYDTDKMTASLGGRFELLDKSLALAATYTQVFYFERTVAPRGRGSDGLTILPDGIDSTYRNPDAAGTYNQSVGVFNLNVQYTF